MIKNLAKLYSRWNEINREKLSLYYDNEKPDIPLENNKELEVSRTIFEVGQFIIQSNSDNEI